MGIISRLMGKSENPRVVAVRNLAKARLEASSPYSELSVAQIDNLPSKQVMALPDATLLTIFENYISLCNAGLSDEDAFRKIEGLRNIAVQGSSDYPTKLFPYLNYRIKLEHAHVSDEQIEVTYQLVKAMLLGK